MAINTIQMQPGLSLTAFLAQYGTEALCEAALERARWPCGFVCPRCQATGACRFRRRGQRYYQCLHCRYQCSLRAGTMMANSRLPLTTWFLALYLVTQSKTNIAALALRRYLGVSWRTAWLLKHKIMEAMRQREQDRPLRGEVRIDDAYLGGERAGVKRGRGSPNKVAFVAAVELREGRPVRARFDPVPGFSFAALTNWAEQALAPGCTLTTDGFLGFQVLGRLGHRHQVVRPPKGKAGTEIEPFRWLNTVLGNLKTALQGTHHAFRFRKYAHRYLADLQYRFNRRYDLAAMMPRLTIALVHATPRSERHLREHAEMCT